MKIDKYRAVLREQERRLRALGIAPRKLRQPAAPNCNTPALANHKASRMTRRKDAIYNCVTREAIVRELARRIA